MNRRVPPETLGAAAPQAAAGAPPAALVTPSYAADFERCRLLCRSVDRHVSGATTHYLLVAGHDVARFRALEGPSRVVVDERDLLPAWLHCVPDPSDLFRRRIWVSRRTMPLRGWHVQQLRRLAVAEALDEPTLVYLDSDVVFLKPFDCARFWRDGALRLYRRDGALPQSGEHPAWARSAGRLLGLPADRTTTHDYIATLIAWRRDAVLAMLRHIEARAGRHWVAAVASTRRYSECMIYGRYVDEVRGGEGHFPDPDGFCRVYWSGPALSGEGIRAFAAGMAPGQVAVGIQSFVGSDLAAIERLVAES